MQSDYYGAEGSSDTKTLRERLREYYEPEDFVTVMNIDTSPIRYQFMPPQNQEFISNAPYHGEIHNKRPPQVVTLQPGETKLCPAYEADLMIEALVKKITISDTTSKIAKGTLEPQQSANWQDPNTQKALINEIFQGKQDLVSKYNETNKVDKDLEIEPTEPAKRGRPAKAV